MNRQLKTYVFLLFGAVVLLAGCKRELDTSWDVNYKGPIGQTRITLEKMLPENSLEVADDSLLTLIYKEMLFSLELDSLMRISDTLSSSLLDVPVTLALPPGQKILEASEETKMDIGDALFTSAQTIKARIRIETVSSSTQPLLIKYAIPSATKNGVPYSVTTTIPAISDSDYVFQIDYMDLEGYTFDFTGLSGHEVNTMVATTTIWIHPDADTVTVVPGDKIHVHTFLEDLDLGYAKGYFGSGDFHIQESSRVGLFETIPTGMLKLDSVSGFIRISNGVGMDARLKLKELKATNDKLGVSIPLSQEIVGQTINISRATDSWGNITPFERIIDLKTNNVHDLINLMPNKISYDLLFQMNPLGNTTLGNDFIYAGHGMDVELEMRTPLNISIDNLLWVDTMSLNLSELKGVQSGSFRLISDNMFPYDLDVQMVLISEHQIIDSLNTSEVSVQHAVLNAQNVAISPTSQTHDIPISAQQIENLKRADRIFIRVRINNPQAQGIYPLRSDNYLDLRLSADFTYRINEEE